MSPDMTDVSNEPFILCAVFNDKIHEAKILEVLEKFSTKLLQFALYGLFVHVFNTFVLLKFAPESSSFKSAHVASNFNKIFYLDQSATLS